MSDRLTPELWDRLQMVVDEGAGDLSDSALLELRARVETLEAANQPNPRGCANPLRDHALFLLPPDCIGKFLTQAEIRLIRAVIEGGMA